ncbi:MAG: acyl-CoA/acyl-ACP dehydrogenase, partial [Deltaproteobacteria bacterium]|nr:acyl-CoA/acyl-ACP dehydrogenase [Deltaproteobacteria bacterium]
MEPIFYSEEENAYQQEAQAFFEREAPPFIVSMERKNEYPFELLKKLGSQHYIGVRYSTEYGGGGRDMLHETIINEEAGAQSYAISCARSVPHHCAHIIDVYGTEEQKRKYLPGIFSGESIVAEAITEPTAGSDAARMKTSAVKKGNQYIINGEKRFQASGAVAHLLVVFAITNPDVHPSKGMSCFLVDTDDPNIVAQEDFDVMGWRGLRVVSELILNGVEVPEENRIGEEGQGFPILIDMLDTERIVVSASLTGGARTCLETAARYSMEREAFHRPLKNFEAISFRVAEMACRIEAARLIRIKAARMFEAGMDVAKMAAMAKVVAAENGFWVANEALQIMGGIGATTKS